MEDERLPQKGRVGGALVIEVEEGLDVKTLTSRSCADH